MWKISDQSSWSAESWYPSRLPKYLLLPWFSHSFTQSFILFFELTWLRWTHYNNNTRLPERGQFQANTTSLSVGRWSHINTKLVSNSASYNNCSHRLSPHSWMNKMGWNEPTHENPGTTTNETTSLNNNIETIANKIVVDNKYGSVWELGLGERIVVDEWQQSHYMNDHQSPRRRS